MAFSKEVRLDELAEAARKDPVEFRLSLLRKHQRATGALKLVAEKSGRDKPFATAQGRGRGVAVHESFGSVVAQVAEVTVSGAKISVDRVVCAVDCGIAVTPDVVKAQMQSGIGYGLSAALSGRITLTDGHVDQSNFHQYQVLRINEMLARRPARFDQRFARSDVLRTLPRAIRRPRDEVTLERRHRCSCSSGRSD